MARRRLKTVHLAAAGGVLALGGSLLFGSLPARGADAVRFAQTKPVVLEPSVPVEVQVLVQRGLETRVAVEQSTADAVGVMCGGEPPAASSCALPRSDEIVIRTVKVAWNGTKPGKGTLVASAAGVPAASLEFTASPDTGSPKSAPPSEVTERTDDSSLYVQLGDAVPAPATPLVVTGTGPTGIVTAELKARGGQPVLSVKDLEAVGAYAWAIDKDGDGKPDLTVKVMRRKPFAVGAAFLAAGALVVAAVIWLRDKRLAALVQQEDVDGLRDLAGDAEDRLIDAMASAQVRRTNQLWAPATTAGEPLSAELARLEASDRTADRSDGAAFATAAKAVDALSAVAAATERAAAILRRLRERTGVGRTPLVASTIAAFEAVDFAGADLGDYPTKATAVKTIASNLALAERIAQTIGTRPQSEQDALYTRLYALAVTDASGLDSLRTEVGTTKRRSLRERVGDVAVVGSVVLMSIPGSDATSTEARRGRRATIQSVRGWIIVLSGGLAFLSGLATTYFGSDIWGSSGDALKAFTWAAGATFTVDAVTKIALSRLAFAPTPKA